MGNITTWGWHSDLAWGQQEAPSECWKSCKTILAAAPGRKCRGRLEKVGRVTLAGTGSNRGATFLFPPPRLPVFLLRPWLVVSNRRGLAK